MESTGVANHNEIIPTASQEKESVFDFGINGLAESSKVKEFLDKIVSGEQDPEKQKALLAKEIAHWRDYSGYSVPEIDNEHQPFTTESEQQYIMWDDKQAEQLLEKYLSLKQMQATLPTAETIARNEPVVDQFAETQKINLSDLEATQKIDLAEVAKAEMEQIMPIDSRTNIERYSDLIVKAEAKAREYEQKPNLTSTEKARLEEIRSDIYYFNEQKKKAVAAEQDKKLAEIPKPKERDREAVREEIIKLKEKPTPKPTPSPLGDPEAIVKVAETITPAAPEKKNFWSKWFGIETETPAPIPKPESKPEPTKADMFFAKNPPPSKLKPVIGEKTLDLGNNI